MGWHRWGTIFLRFQSLTRQLLRLRNFISGGALTKNACIRGIPLYKSPKYTNSTQSVVST